MSVDLTRNAETRAAVATIEGIDDVAIARLTGVDMIRLTISISGQRVSTYIGLGTSVADAVLSTVSSPWVDQLPDADAMERLVAQAEEMDDVHDVRLHPSENGYLPTMTMMAAGIGHVKLDILPDNAERMLDQELKQMRRNRAQDAEGRTLSRLGAMSLALIANDAADVDRLVDTVFSAGTVIYRGIDCKVQKGDRIVTCLQIGTTRIRSDSIGLSNLPDTIKISVRGNAYKDRPLSDLVDVAGFEDLRIAKIDARPRATRLTEPGTGWIYIDVRDTIGATLDELEREQARTVAQDTFERRRVELAARG